MGHPTPYPRCIFCGDRANSREHAIPKWIARRFGKRGVTLQTVSTINIKEPRRQPISFGSHRERIFCKGCNKHFKRLEDEVISLIEPMALGLPKTFSAEHQLTLARWGAKTGFALIAAERDLRSLVPSDDCRWLRESDEPPANVWVGYASWNGPIYKFAGDMSLVDAQNRSHQAYGALLTFEQLALKFFGLIDPLADHQLAFDTPSLKQVWPRVSDMMNWPLFPAAQEGNIEQLAQLPPLTHESRY